MGARMRMLVAGSGSGGHLRPALALADALRGMEPDLEVLFCTPGDGVEWRFLGGSPWRHLTVRRVRLGSRDLPALSHAARGIHEVRRFHPHVALGTGGAGGILALLAARLAGASLVLLEPNRVAGRANRLLAHIARRVLTQFPGTRSTLPLRVPVSCCGLPVRADLVASCSKEGARRALGLEPSRPTVLVLGGSQGALSLNRRMVLAAPRLASLPRKVQVLHIAGPGKEEDLAERYRSSGIAARVLPFVDAMPIAYRASDLAVARSGGSTLAELAVVALPSVLVPYPHSPDRHQFDNAERFVACGAAVAHDETSESGEKLGTLLVELLGGEGSEERLRSMRASAARLGNPMAGLEAARIVRSIAAARRPARGLERGAGEEGCERPETIRPPAVGVAGGGVAGGEESP